MPGEALNVVALVSGGKDSFYSILHCLRNGHRVVALANLYPAADAVPDDEDLNSFMYQTVGHQVIPLYAHALQLPLYRQSIRGTAVRTGVTYAPTAEGSGALDETESLVPLLTTVRQHHPDVTAVCSGAILSSYQRTRVESVVLRLGLVPLAWLWQYPRLEGCAGAALLRDMQAAGLRARIVKVATGGLDASALWEDVTAAPGRARVQRAMRRFGDAGHGAVLGEGGEFETLAVDGPRTLFRGRIEVAEQDRGVVREGGGQAWMRIRKAEVVMKDEAEEEFEVRVPALLEKEFEKCLVAEPDVEEPMAPVQVIPVSISTFVDEPRGGMFWTVTADAATNVEEEMRMIVDKTQRHLKALNLDASDIIFTTILLRSMADFGSVNKVYSTLFTQPNPPSRVTISCGPALSNAHVVLHLTLSPTKSKQKSALHVQSRSYWAPSNIGPYAQAISIPLSTAAAVHIAGQIPLVPATMALPIPAADASLADAFTLQAALALQHLWRIGTATHVRWWSSAVAYLAHTAGSPSPRQRARLAANVWRARNRVGRQPDVADSDDERDLWEERHHAGLRDLAAAGAAEAPLPDWSIVDGAPGPEAPWDGTPPFFAAEVDELPRASSVEWHAHLGFTGGPIKLETPRITYSPEGMSVVVHRSSLGASSHTTVLFHAPLQTPLDSLSDVLAGSSATQRRATAYVDASTDFGVWTSLFARISRGEAAAVRVVPCRSLWDAEGARLVGAVVMEEEEDA